MVSEKPCSGLLVDRVQTPPNSSLVSRVLQTCAKPSKPSCVSVGSTVDASSGAIAVHWCYATPSGHGMASEGWQVVKTPVVFEFAAAATTGAVEPVKTVDEVPALPMETPVGPAQVFGPTLSKASLPTGVTVPRMLRSPRSPRQREASPDELYNLYLVVGLVATTSSRGRSPFVDSAPAAKSAGVPTPKAVAPPVVVVVPKAAGAAPTVTRLMAPTSPPMPRPQTTDVENWCNPTAGFWAAMLADSINMWTAEKMIAYTLSIVGGKTVGSTSKTAGSSYYEFKLEETKLGNLTFAVTGLQSRAGSDELKKMGPRMYFRGVTTKLKSENQELVRNLFSGLDANWGKK